MQKLAHFNCSSGIAGDMIIASLIDAGVNPVMLESSIKNTLKLKNWRFKINNQGYHHYPAKTLVIEGDRQFDSPHSMLDILQKSTLTKEVKLKSIQILKTLIDAESKVHKTSHSKVHFHELNALDTIVDVVGSVMALDILGVKKISCSNINIGKSAPATLQIVKSKSIPVYSDNSIFELATPTGMAIISNICSSFEIMPSINVDSFGFSAGTQKMKNKSNLLQVIIGTEITNTEKYDEKILLETNIDDMDPRVYPYVSEMLLKNGATDVWLTQIMMKKGRPGIQLSILCEAEKEKGVTDIIFNETTTLGIRRIPLKRHILPRQIKGEIKTAYLRNGRIKQSREFEKVKQTAKRKSKKLKDLL